MVQGAPPGPRRHLAPPRPRRLTLPVTDLLAPETLEDGDLRIEPLGERHREALRAACAADAEIWRIYPFSMLGDAFDEWWDGIRIQPGRAYQAILADGTLIGTSSYTVTDTLNHIVEIGGTYFHPDVRGTGVNTRVKRLMVGAVFAAGARRLEFRIDAINERSRRAVEKLGARLDGILRSNRVTWTGRVRDTCVYSVLAEEAEALPLFRHSREGGNPACAEGEPRPENKVD